MSWHWWTYDLLLAHEGGERMGLKNVGKARISNSGGGVNLKVSTEEGEKTLTMSVKSLEELIRGDKPYINVALVIPDSEGETKN